MVQSPVDVIFFLSMITRNSSFPSYFQHDRLRYGTGVVSVRLIQSGDVFAAIACPEPLSHKNLDGFTVSPLSYFQGS